MSLLSVVGLGVNYGGVPALRGIDLTVAAGEVVGVVGANGAGKTTLLAAIMRLVPWAAGSVAVDGRSLAKDSPDAVARAGVALVPEGRQIFGSLTVEENLRLGLVARADRSPGAKAAAFDEALALFPQLGEYAARPAGVLSGGQQQQLAIARALMADPKLLLLDEPSLGLAPTMIDLVFEAIATLRARGRTIVVVEQRAHRTIAFADRTLVLTEGAVTAELRPGDEADTDRLRAAYFGTGTTGAGR